MNNLAFLEYQCKRIITIQKSGIDPVQIKLPHIDTSSSIITVTVLNGSFTLCIHKLCKVKHIDVAFSLRNGDCFTASFYMPPC